MSERRSARPLQRSRGRRALLVGLTPLMMRALEGPLAESLEVSAVPFPGTAFDRAVTSVRPDLVVVDVTYLDERRVRPLLMERFRQLGSAAGWTTLAVAGRGRLTTSAPRRWSACCRSPRCAC